MRKDDVGPRAARTAAQRRDACRSRNSLACSFRLNCLGAIFAGARSTCFDRADASMEVSQQRNTRACTSSTRRARKAYLQKPRSSRDRLRQVQVRAGSSAKATAPHETADGRRKVSLVNLGCPKNTVDGEVLLGDLSRAGFEVTEDHDDTDAVIVNTCAFVDDAKAESLQAILEASELKASGSTKRVVVTGCLAQRYAGELAESIPEADIVMGFENYGNLSSSLQNLLGEATSTVEERVQVGEATVPFRAEWDRHSLTPRHSAYLRVAEGCSHACSFCAIPRWRGKFRSKPWGAILEEAEVLVARGARELNLIAEDTNQWGMDRRDCAGLAQLLRSLAQIEGVRWLRLLYCYPSYFTDELIDEIATNPKVCKYIDIPLQHINNVMLLGMNRPPRAHTEQLLLKLRDRIPDLALRTTFISGFPGETEEQHAELVDFCSKFRFERMGCFAYSEEDGTPAAAAREQVPRGVRETRRDELIALQQSIGQRHAESLVGTEVDVLVDGLSEEGEPLGRTQWDAPDVDPVVFLSEAEGGPPLEAGQLRRCRVTGASLFDLVAAPID